MSMDRIVRHRGSDRLFHWVMAASVLLLLGTGLLPALGIRFDWVALHWISGLVLVAAILFHIVRVSTGGNLRTMLPSKRDLEQVRATLGAPPVRPGKYSVAQKAMHYVAALLSLAAVATGLLMMVKVDTPFWARNPYWLDAGTWGGIYVVHGFAALVPGQRRDAACLFRAAPGEAQVPAGDAAGLDEPRRLSRAP